MGLYGTKTVVTHGNGLLLSVYQLIIFRSQVRRGHGTGSSHSVVWKAPSEKQQNRPKVVLVQASYQVSYLKQVVYQPKNKLEVGSQHTCVVRPMLVHVL